MDEYEDRNELLEHITELEMAYELLQEKNRLMRKKMRLLKRIMAQRRKIIDMQNAILDDQLDDHLDENGVGMSTWFTLLNPSLN